MHVFTSKKSLLQPFHPCLSSVIQDDFFNMRKPFTPKKQFQMECNKANKSQKTYSEKHFIHVVFVMLFDLLSAFREVHAY